MSHRVSIIAANTKIAAIMRIAKFYSALNIKKI